MTLKVFLFAITLSLFACKSSQYKRMYDQSTVTTVKGKFTVTGTALDDKGGAFVLSDSATNGKSDPAFRIRKNGMYFVNGLDEWDEKYYGKKVEVSGTKLILEKMDINLSTDSIKRQQFFGTRATIIKPRWKLLN